MCDTKGVWQKSCHLLFPVMNGFAEIILETNAVNRQAMSYIKKKGVWQRASYRYSVTKVTSMESQYFAMWQFD